MGLFNHEGKPTYVALAEPSFDTCPIPDIKLFRRDGPMVREMVTWVQEQVSRYEADGSQGSALLTDLQNQLLGAFTSSGAWQVEDLGPLLRFTCQMGYFLGVMENAGGVARPECSESHYWTALLVLYTQVPMEDSIRAPLMYSLWAGYYVARVGEAAIESTVARATAWSTREPEKVHA